MSDRIRVVHLIDHMGLGGAEMMLLKLLENMDGDAFESSVVSMTALGPVGERVNALGLPVHLLGMQRGQPRFGDLLRLVRVLRELRPDVLQTWMVSSDFAGVVAGKLAGVRRVLWNIRGSALESGDASKRTLLLKRVCAKLSRLPDIVVSNSEAGKDAHAALGYHPREWRILPNGFDVDVFVPDETSREEVRDELGIPRDVPVVGIVGRYHPMKDHLTFVRAAILAHRVRDLRFVMVGTGLTVENSAIVDAGRSLLDAGSLHLVGARADVARLYPAMDVFSLTSRCGEGFPNVVGEAMSCGVPCVVTDTAGDAAAIVGDTGLVVPCGDPDALSKAWIRLLEFGPSDLRQAGMCARERIRSRYEVKQIVRDYEAMYRQVVRGGKR